MSTNENQKILAFATQGSNGDDENRLKSLLSKVQPYFYPFERINKRKSFWGILRHIICERPNLVVMEGTGLSGGMALLLGLSLRKVPYVISSGDAVGPYISSKHPMLGPLFNWYERRLYKHATGFIGWTPYLTGRALTYGSKFAMTAAGWAPSALCEEDIDRSRSYIRKRFGIPVNNIVVGIVGSLNWNRRAGYCYGYELVMAAQKLKRKDITVFIVGDGDGRGRLEKITDRANLSNVIYTGRIPREEVPKYLAAMDLASLPQSIDQVGSFRYTTKLSEYLSAGLPIVMGKTPMSYDLNGEWIYRIQGIKPWSDTYIESLVVLLEDISSQGIKERKKSVPRKPPLFDKDVQISNVSEFIQDILLEIKA
ncbi:glycosyltransferase [Cohnella luojiensis]|uniref:Glycosyltransferase n=1 Tax=Cohnella luojiensis TaxID=652876 RepID=A0A4Y8LT77_9BACL|nr:glycosyltransferase [Cohnella luojiensis]TFE22645.1 glycosyltransferase [Cohnella luojiensis]